MYKQGDLLIVPFPFSDLSSVKKRPVLLISKDTDNYGEDIIVCGITSNLISTKHSIFITNSDLEFGNIPRDSKIKVDKLFTIDKKIVVKKFARLNKKTLNKVKIEFNDLI